MPFKQTSFLAETVDWSARGAALDLPETADVAESGPGSPVFLLAGYLRKPALKSR
jgi:hypothetical protein